MGMAFRGSGPREARRFDRWRARALGLLAGIPAIATCRVPGPRIGRWFAGSGPCILP